MVFKKKDIIDTDAQLMDTEPINPILLMGEEQKLAIMDRIGREINLGMSLSADKRESYNRTEEVISPTVTRSIDLYEKDENGSFNPKRSREGHSWELTGSLGNILPSQDVFFRMANFNAQWCKLRDGIYLDIYEMNKETGMPVLDTEGNPHVIKTELVDIAQMNRDMIANTNLALGANRAKLHGQTLVGQSGGSPLGVGGSWDDTLNILFGGDRKKK